MYRLFGNFSFSAHQTRYPDDQQLSEIGSSAIGQTDTGIPLVINGLCGMGQQETLLFKVFGTNKVMTIKNWSELWVSDQPEIRVELSDQPNTLWDARHDGEIWQ